MSAFWELHGSGTKSQTILCSGASNLRVVSLNTEFPETENTRTSAAAGRYAIVLMALSYHSKGKASAGIYIGDCAKHRQEGSFRAEPCMY